MSNPGASFPHELLSFLERLPSDQGVVIVLDADDLAEPAPDVTVSAAPRRPRKVRPEAAEPSLPHEPAEGAGVDAMQAEPVDAEAASAEPDRQERAPWETMTLVDVQRQYVAEHPDDAKPVGKNATGKKPQVAAGAAPPVH